MFEIAVSPEFLTYLLAGLVAILFDWAPTLATWYDGLSVLKKQQFMGAILLGIVAVIFGGMCAGILVTGLACDKAGAASLIQIWLIAVGVNQGIHTLTKPSGAAKQALAARK